MKITKLNDDMKLFKHAFFKVLLGAAAAVPMVTSCYDDSKLWDEIYNINSTISEMKNSLNGQLQAFNDLVAGGNILISECRKMSNGTYAITLSNGTKFNVLQEGKSLEGLVSYLEVDGEKCWAMYGNDGKLTLLQNSDNEYIPVQSAVPYVEERNGDFYLIVGDEEYKTGFDFEDRSVITDYVMNKDDSGNIYSVTFSFGSENLKFTVPVDGYKGFSFRLGTNVIKDLYVDYASTYQITAGLDGVVDYVMQIPDGWRVKEVVDESTGELYLDVTAPAKAVVEAGAAVESGNLKVVAVVEGGDAMVAKLELTTSPFKTFTSTSTNVIIERNNGVDKYLYGLTLKTAFDEAAIFASADEMLKANEAANVASADINVLISEMLGAEVTPGEKYVLWAVPAFYDMSGEENAGFYVKEGLICTYEFGGSVIKLDVKETRFNDAFIAFTLEGGQSYYAGTVLKEEGWLDEVIYRVNNDVVEPVTEPLTYEGSAFDFPSDKANSSVTPVSETSYITWVVPVVESKSAYSADDVISTEFTLEGVTAGGSLEVTAGEAAVDRTSISVPLSSEGATRIYYVFLTDRQAGRVLEADRADYLLANGEVVDGDTVVAYADMLDPKSKRVIFAMATDTYGRYGAVTEFSYTTDELVYNADLSVTVTPIIAEVGQKTANVKVEVAGGEASGYVYWIGRSIDEFWINMGKKAANVQQYLALYPDDSDVARIMYNNPIEDGILKISGLRGEAEYQVVVLAKGADGLYSKAGSCSFETLAADLGTIVRAGSTEWENVKSQVEIEWNHESFRLPENSNMSAFYSFSIKCPKNLTAFILCATESYFNDNPDTQTVEHRIIDIESQCARKYDAGKTAYDESGESLLEPDWVDDSGQLHKGQMLNLYSFYVHGYPTNGFATYFGEGLHEGKGCSSWDGSCSNYAYALEHITRRHSVDYYKDYVKNTRGGYCKSEEVINKVAQDLFEAYYPHYKDAEPLIYINDGTPLHMEQHYAAGLDDKGNVMDSVFVVFKDASGNYYEPMSFGVPNSFK